MKSETTSTAVDVSNLERERTRVQNGAAIEGEQILEERKLSIPEAARLMGIGTTSLRRIVSQGRLPVLKILRKVLILESDAKAFLRDSRVVVKRVVDGDSRLPALPESVAKSRHLAVQA